AGLLDKKTALSDRMRVEQVMRRNVEGIAEHADFNEVVHFVEHSHDNTYPVLDEERCVVGLIRFDLLNQAFFDPHVDTLLRAGDLATPPEVLLRPSQPVRDAVDLFRHTNDDCVPVVTDDKPARLIGTVRRSDLTTLLIRDRKAGVQGTGGSAGEGSLMSAKMGYQQEAGLAAEASAGRIVPGTDSLRGSAAPG
ncbi:MAG: CBS domain-containing protein, partial [Planctomycetota bacterium]